MSDPRRALGALGERLAAEHLERAGYRIVERNYRTRYGELDIVAAGDRCLVFCEVKPRLAARTSPHPFDWIGNGKRTQVRQMPAHWLAERRAQLDEPAQPLLRF